MATKIVKKRHLEAAKPYHEYDEHAETDCEGSHGSELSSQDGEESEQLHCLHQDKETTTILTRILKLSNQAENPGMAYRNLETIHALTETLVEKFDITIKRTPNPSPYEKPSNKRR